MMMPYIEVCLFGTQGGIQKMDNAHQKLGHCPEPVLNYFW